MTQTARPDEDIDGNTWTTAPLWSKVNDSSDSTYINSGRYGTGYLGLTSLSDPQSSSDHVLYVRAKVAYGINEPETLYFFLYQGETYIASSGPTTISRTTITTYSKILSTAETDSITDYGALRVRAYVTDCVVSESINVYDIWFECPDAPVVSTHIVNTSSVA